MNLLAAIRMLWNSVAPRSQSDADEDFFLPSTPTMKI
jgi:hypothetical protein